MSRAGAAKVAWTALIVLLAAFPFVASGSYYQFMLILVFIYSVVAIGLNILAGYGGQFSLGHAALMAMGAYTTAIASKAMGHVPFLAASGLNVWLGILAGTAVAALSGVVLAYPSLRLKGPYLAMVTIAFGWVIWKILLEWVPVTGGELGITAIPKAKIGSFVLTTSYYYHVALIAVLAALLVQRNLIKSEFGRRLRAIKHSEIAAASVGIDVYREKIKIFVVSAVFAGFGGALFAHQQNFINPDNFQFFNSVFFLLAVLFGGAGTLLGPVIGALVLTMLPELLHDFDRIRLIVYGIFILATLYVLPNGVAGLWRRKAKASLDFIPDGTGSTRPVFGQTSADSSTSVLEVEGISKIFGGLTALNNVSLSLAAGRVHAVIGPNGAGKTTLINIISGFYRPNGGSMRIDGEVVAVGSPHAAAKLGIARTFQTIKLFGDMTALENVMVGFQRHSTVRVWDCVFKTARARNEERLRAEDALGLLKFVGLGEFAAQPADSLAYGHRRLLEIARALAVRPRLLLLDEPAAGLVATEIEALKNLIAALRERGVAILLVEHHMDLVTAISDRITVLDYGEVIAVGNSADIQNDPHVIEAYLGTEVTHA